MRPAARSRCRSLRARRCRDAARAGYVSSRQESSAMDSRRIEMGARSKDVHMAAALVAVLFAPIAVAQFDTGITYQGELESGGSPKTGTVDLRFDQFLAETGGTTPFDPVIVDGVVLDQGRFTVQLPFPPSTFATGQVFIEVGVREDAAGGPADITGFTSLLPRQKVTPTPYSLIARKVLDDAVA